MRKGGWGAGANPELVARRGAVAQQSSFPADRERAVGRAKASGGRFAWLEPQEMRRGGWSQLILRDGQGEPRGPDGRRPRGAAAAERSSAGQTRVFWPGPVKAGRAPSDLLPQTHTPPPPSARPAPAPPTRLAPLLSRLAHTVAELKPNLPPLQLGFPEPAAGLGRRCLAGPRPWTALRPPRWLWESGPGSYRSRHSAPLSASSRSAEETGEHGPGGDSLPAGTRLLDVAGELSAGYGFRRAPATAVLGFGPGGSCGVSWDTRKLPTKGATQTTRRRATVKKELRKKSGKDQSAG